MSTLSWDILKYHLDTAYSMCNFPALECIHLTMILSDLIYLYLLNPFFFPPNPESRTCPKQPFSIVSLDTVVSVIQIHFSVDCTRQYDRGVCIHLQLHLFVRDCLVVTRWTIWYIVQVHAQKHQAWCSDPYPNWWVACHLHVWHSLYNKGNWIIVENL